MNAPPPHHQQMQQQPQPLALALLNNNNVVVFIAVSGLCAYTVYTNGNLQSFIYAVCGAYVLRMLMRNPELVRQLHDQLNSLIGGRRSFPQQQQQRSPVLAQRPSPVQEMYSQPNTAQPRLDMNFLDHHQQMLNGGYQALPPRRTTSQFDEHDQAPVTPTPAYNPSYQQPQQLHQRVPSRPLQTVVEDYASPSHGMPPRGHSQTPNLYAQINNGANSVDFANLSPAAAAAARVAAAVAAMRPDSRMSDFAPAISNPYGSYSHYDAGTINGERIAGASQPLPSSTMVQEAVSRSASTRPGSAMAASRSSPPRANTMHAPSPLAQTMTSPVSPNGEYVPKRKHRMPTISARVGEAGAPGAGITPALNAPSSNPLVMLSQQHNNGLHHSPTMSSGSSNGSGSHYMDSPLVTSPLPVQTMSRHHNGYESESDSSHTSSSAAHHARSESLGLPTYEKHATTIVTLVPKRPGYVPQIQATLKASRTAWLALVGTVSHEVGQDESTGAIVIVETYESAGAMDEYEKSAERDVILANLKKFVDEDKTTVVRLPGSSAATRIVR